MAALSIVIAGCGAASAQPAGTAPAFTLAGTAGTSAPPHRGSLFPGLRYGSGGVARLTGARPPSSAALPGANDLLAAGPAVLAATDRGIWRSTDRGAGWRPVLAGVVTWSLTAVPGGGFAAIGNLPAKNRPGRPVLATSGDGVHWRVRRARARGAGPVSSFGYGYRIALGGLRPTSAGIAVPDLVASSFGGRPLRSTDGGRSWQRLALPAASTGLSMLADGHTIFVTAPGHGSSCGGAVYRSTDAGASWRLLAGSCQRFPLAAVQFIDARHGFAAGGMPFKYSGGQVVEATSDGGLTWHTRWHAGQAADPSFSEIVRLDMVSARRGWALEGGCVGGQNGPCAGAVQVTTDGGFRWHPTAQAATSIAGLGAGTALAGDAPDAILAASTDGGRRWQAQAPPRWVSTSAFSGVAGTQLWLTNLGVVSSTDGGARWAVPAAPTAASFGDETWLAATPDRLLGFSQAGRLATRVSGDGGRTWTTSRIKRFGFNDQVLAGALGRNAAAIAVTGDGADCTSSAAVREVRKLTPGWKRPSSASALFTSTDGGSRWQLAGAVLPFGVAGLAASAVDGRQLAIIDACNRLQLSADGGRHWKAEALGNAPSCTISAEGSELWLACTTVSAAGVQRFYVLHSRNGGVSWTQYRLPETAAANGLSSSGAGAFTAIGLTGIFATGRGAAVMPAGGSLWRTSDGGTSWVQSWPALPGD
jgi:photosystem II stability/assembly factor-like uncharacterized protein